MSIPTSPLLDRPRRRTRRWRTLLSAAILLVLAAPVVCWQYLRWSQEHSVAAAVAETDRLDPHWRFDELLTARPPVPHAENSSLLVVRLAKRGVGLLQDADYEALQLWAPPALLDDAHTVRLRDYVGKHAAWLAEARTLRDLPRGRPPIRYTTDLLSTTLGPVQDARTICAALHCDVLLRAQDDDMEGAMQSCRAMLNAGRSVGDEPFLVVQLVRTACTHLTIDALERILAQGEPAEADLAAMQAALEREFAEPVLRNALRGERAALFEVLEKMRQGNLRPSTVAAVSGTPLPPAGQFLYDYFPVAMGADPGSYLRMMNELIAASELPVEKQVEEFARVRDRWKDKMAQPPGAMQRFGQTGINAHLRLQANLPCAIAALAAERHRVRHGRWPESLDALVQAGLLRAVPLDPFAGQPLRLKRGPDGLVIYSVGADRADDGGVINRSGDASAGTDLGFRLWDVGARRRPAP